MMHMKNVTYTSGWSDDKTVNIFKLKREANMFSVAFYCLKFDWFSFNVLFFCNGLMAPRELAPPAVYLDEPTPNIHTTVVDGNINACFLLQIFWKFG